MQRWDCFVSTIYSSQTQTFQGISRDFFSQDYCFFSVFLFVLIYPWCQNCWNYSWFRSVVTAAFFPLAASLHYKGLLACIDSLASFHFSFPDFCSLHYAAVSDCFHHRFLLQRYHHNLLPSAFKETRQEWRKSLFIFSYLSLLYIK